MNLNRESGKGEYDVRPEPKGKNANSFIMEFKVIKGESKESIEKTIKGIMRQIKDKKYETNQS